MLIIISYTTLNSQEISFIVKDSISLLPIPYVKVSIKNKEEGTYSNLKGWVKMENICKDDELSMMCIGYEKKLLKTDEIIALGVVYLTPKTYFLNEIVILDKKYQDKEIGYRKIYSHDRFGTNIIGTEVAVLIKNTNKKDAFIKKIYANIKLNSKSSPVIRFHLYKNKQEKPGEEFYMKNNIVVVNNRSKIELDIEKEHILFPKEGVFVSIEWLGTYYSKEKILNNNDTTKAFDLFIKTSRRAKKGTVSYYRVWSEWKPFLNNTKYIPLFGLLVSFF